MPPIRPSSTTLLERSAQYQQSVEPKRQYYILCEGEVTEKSYFRGIRDNRAMLGIDKLVNVVILERYGQDFGASHPKSLLEMAQAFKSSAETSFIDGRDKLVLVFDVDIYAKRSKSAGDNNDYTELINRIQAEGIIPAITNPAFELFLLLHLDNAYEKYILPNAGDILANKKIGARRQIDRIFSEAAGISPKRNGMAIERLACQANVAISQEVKLNQDVYGALDRLTSNVGDTIASMIADKGD